MKRSFRDTKQGETSVLRSKPFDPMRSLRSAGGDSTSTRSQELEKAIFEKIKELNLRDRFDASQQCIDTFIEEQAKGKSSMTNIEALLSETKAINTLVDGISESFSSSTKEDSKLVDRHTAHLKYPINHFSQDINLAITFQKLINKAHKLKASMDGIQQRLEEFMKKDFNKDMKNKILEKVGDPYADFSNFCEQMEYSRNDAVCGNESRKRQDELYDLLSAIKKEFRLSPPEK